MCQTHSPSELWDQKCQKINVCTHVQCKGWSWWMLEDQTTTMSSLAVTLTSSSIEPFTES